MKLRITLLLIAGALMSLFAGFGTYRYASALESELAAARGGLRVYGDSVAVPVPARDIARGERLTPKDFRLVTVPRFFVPPNVLTILPPRHDDRGIVALMGLREGAFLLRTDLASTPREGELDLLISADGSSMALSPLNLEEVRPLLTPGDTVDIVWTRPTGGGTSESRMIGVALRVLAVPQRSTSVVAPDAQGQADADKWDAMAGKILIEGSRADILRFVQAEQSGTFRILLAGEKRVPSASEMTTGAGDLAKLPPIAEDSPVSRSTAKQASNGSQDSLLLPLMGSSERPRCVTAIIRGGTRSTLEVPC